MQCSESSVICNQGNVGELSCKRWGSGVDLRKMMCGQGVCSSGGVQCGGIMSLSCGVLQLFTPPYSIRIPWFCGTASLATLVCMSGDLKDLSSTSTRRVGANWVASLRQSNSQPHLAESVRMPFSHSGTLSSSSGVKHVIASSSDKPSPAVIISENDGQQQ